MEFASLLESWKFHFGLMLPRSVSLTQPFYSVCKLRTGRNQHRAQWQGLGDTQRQARELISGPSLGSRAKFMTFNRFQSRAVTGLLTGHNTLRRHLHLLGLHDSPLCRKCGVREETSAHILCECEALASLRHAHLGSFFRAGGYQENRLGGHLDL